MKKITFIFLIFFGFTILNIAQALAECNIVWFDSTGYLDGSIATNETSRTPQAAEELVLFVHGDSWFCNVCDGGDCGWRWDTYSQCYQYFGSGCRGGEYFYACIDGSLKSGSSICGPPVCRFHDYLGTWDVVCGITTTTTQQSTTTTSAPATVIDLSLFTATPKSGKIILEWSTESEIDNAGFNIYRSISEDGGYLKINDSLIPAKGSSTQGATYEFTDINVQNRKTYYYKLEDIDLNGTSTMHGPVSATPRLIYGIGK